MKLNELEIKMINEKSKEILTNLLFHMKSPFSKYDIEKAFLEGIKLGAEFVMDEADQFKTLKNMKWDDLELFTEVGKKKFDK